MADELMHLRFEIVFLHPVNIVCKFYVKIYAAIVVFDILQITRNLQKCSIACNYFT